MLKHQSSWTNFFFSLRWLAEGNQGWVGPKTNSVAENVWLKQQGTDSQLGFIISPWAWQWCSSLAPGWFFRSIVCVWHYAMAPSSPGFRQWRWKITKQRWICFLKANMRMCETKCDEPLPSLPPRLKLALPPSILYVSKPQSRMFLVAFVAV